MKSACFQFRMSALSGTMPAKRRARSHSIQLNRKTVLVIVVVVVVSAAVVGGAVVGAGLSGSIRGPSREHRRHPLVDLRNCCMEINDYPEVSTCQNAFRREDAADQGIKASDGYGFPKPLRRCIMRILACSRLQTHTVCASQVCTSRRRSATFAAFGCLSLFEAPIEPRPLGTPSSLLALWKALLGDEVLPIRCPLNTQAS